MVEYIKTAHLKHKMEWFEWLPVSNRGVCGSEEGMFCKTIDCLPCPSCCMENKRGVVRNLGKIWLDVCVKINFTAGCGSCLERDAGSAVEISY